jgi:hypothetical protein
MNDQYFYLQLIFTPKFGTRIHLNTGEHKVAVDCAPNQPKRDPILNDKLLQELIAKRGEQQIYDIRNQALAMYSSRALPGNLGY